jgi:hypothetical protein
MQAEQGQRGLRNEGNNARAPRAKIQCDKGNDTSATAQTCQVDGGNNTGAMTVMTPMRHEGKEVSAIRTTTQGQQGRYNARAILAFALAQQGQRCHSYNSKNACASTMVMTPL